MTMKRIVYSPDYKEKIIQLRNDLDLKYGPSSRKKVLADINHRLQLLRTQNYLGISLREMYGIDCDFYYLFVAHNYIFYEVGPEIIFVINMYHEREDHIIKFLGNITRLHEDSLSDDSPVSF